jgi:hypothetical protein
MQNEVCGKVLIRMLFKHSIGFHSKPPSISSSGVQQPSPVQRVVDSSRRYLSTTLESNNGATSGTYGINQLINTDNLREPGLCPTTIPSPSLSGLINPAVNIDNSPTEEAEGHGHGASYSDDAHHSPSHQPEDSEMPSQLDDMNISFDHGSAVRDLSPCQGAGRITDGMEHEMMMSVAEYSGDASTKATPQLGIGLTGADTEPAKDGSLLLQPDHVDQDVNTNAGHSISARNKLDEAPCVDQPAQQSSATAKNDTAVSDRNEHLTVQDFENPLDLSISNFEAPKSQASPSGAPMPTPPKNPQKQRGNYFDAATLRHWVRGLGSRATQQLTSLFVEEDFAGEADTGDRTVDNSKDPDPNASPNVGKIWVHINCANRFDVVDAADGDLFVQVSIEDSGLSGHAKAALVAKTRIIRSSAAPHFNKSWIFPVPHFHCSLRISLMNARDGSIIGSHKMTIYSLIMRDADFFDSNWAAATEQVYPLYKSDAAAVGKSPAPSTSDVSLSGDSGAAANVKATIKFEENWKALYIDYVPFAAPAGPEDEFSVERLSKHVARFQAAISVIVLVYTEYCRLMDWEDILFTGVCFVVFVYTTLTCKAEYALCCPMFVVVLLATIARHRRLNGHYRNALIRNDKRGNEMYRPLATLRIAALNWRLASNGNSKKPYICVSYSPMPELHLPAASSAEYNREHIIGTFQVGAAPASLAAGGTQSFFGILGEDTKGKDRESVIQNVLDPIRIDEVPTEIPDANFKKKTKTGNDVSAGRETDIVSMVYPLMQSVNGTSQLVPWSHNTGVIKISVHKDKPAGLVSSYRGSVSLMLQHLVDQGSALRGWCQLHTAEAQNVSSYLVFILLAL